MPQGSDSRLNHGAWTLPATAPVEPKQAPKDNFIGVTLYLGLFFGFFFCIAVFKACAAYKRRFRQMRSIGRETAHASTLPTGPGWEARLAARRTANRDRIYSNRDRVRTIREENLNRFYPAAGRRNSSSPVTSPSRGDTNFDWAEPGRAGVSAATEEIAVADLTWLVRGWQRGTSSMHITRDNYMYRTTT